MLQNRHNYFFFHLKVELNSLKRLQSEGDQLIDFSKWALKLWFHILLRKFTTIFFDRSQLSLIDHSHNRSQLWQLTVINGHYRSLSIIIDHLCFRDSWSRNWTQFSNLAITPLVFKEPRYYKILKFQSKFVISDFENHWSCQNLS